MWPSSGSAAAWPKAISSLCADHCRFRRVMVAWQAWYSHRAVICRGLAPVAALASLAYLLVPLAASPLLPLSSDASAQMWQTYSAQSSQCNYFVWISSQQPIGSSLTPASTAHEAIASVYLVGKIAIVTGGYSGLGLETVRALIHAGTRVIVPARDLACATTARKGLPGATVDVLDLADPRSIDEFAARSGLRTLPCTCWNILFAVEPDARGAADGIRAFSVHPGTVMGPLARSRPSLVTHSVFWSGMSSPRHVCVTH